MAARMGDHFDKLTRADVTASHWALIEAADEVNEVLKKWFHAQVEELSSSL